MISSISLSGKTLASTTSSRNLTAQYTISLNSSPVEDVGFPRSIFSTNFEISKDPKLQLPKGGKGSSPHGLVAVTGVYSLIA